MNEQPSVAVIIPVFNEEEALPHVLRALRTVHAGAVYVIDGGSSDGTVAAAEQWGATVLVEAQRGYGRACMTGAEAAIAAGARTLVFLDGDFSDDPTYLPALLAPLRAGRADLVIGARPPRLRQAGAMPAHQSAGNAVVAALIRLLHGVPVSDLGPFRAMPSAVYRALDLRETTYGWPVEAVVRAGRQGYRVREVAVPYRTRIGVSKISGTVQGSLRAGYHMIASVLRERVSPRP